MGQWSNVPQFLPAKVPDGCGKTLNPRNLGQFGKTIWVHAKRGLGSKAADCANGRVRPLADYSLDELRKEFAQAGFAESHAAKVLRGFYSANPGAMQDSLLPRRLMELLQESPRSLARQVARNASEDGTVKLLLSFGDQKTVETVLMPDFRADRAAGCVSSQVGCAMACDFCATTKTGFERNLSAGEIVEQFLALRGEALAAGRRLQTLVFMGMGEPLLNLDAVMEAIRRIADNALGGLGWRQVTVSTVGIVPAMDLLAQSGLNVPLAVSLHAPDDATRERLLPAGRRFGLSDILAATDRYREKTGRPVTVQYCLLNEVNDSPEQAHLLCSLIGTRPLHVNLLRYNPTGMSLRGVHYAPSPDARVDAFAAVLASHRVVAHVRRPRGRDIDAACGQLRRRHEAQGSRA